jgi:flagellar biosynthetic protein FlhB
LAICEDIPPKALNWRSTSDGSEERQLDPTERRLERAREEGQLAQSRDLTTFLVLLLFAGCLLGVGGSLMKGLVLLVQQGLTFGTGQDWQEHLAELGQRALNEHPHVGCGHRPAPLVGVGHVASWPRSSFSPFGLSNRTPGRTRVWAHVFQPNLGRGFRKNILKVIIVFGVGVVYAIGLVGQISVLLRQDGAPGLAQQCGLDRNRLVAFVAAGVGGCGRGCFHSVVQFHQAHEDEPGKTPSKR